MLVILQHQWTFNIVLQARDSKGCTWGTDISESSDDNNKSSTLSMLWSVLSVTTSTTWSKPEVDLHHTPYYFTETLAIILNLFSILYHWYYSQNYSGIIISGLTTFWESVLLQLLLAVIVNTCQSCYVSSPLTLSPLITVTLRSATSISQVTRTRSKSGAVVKHQRMFVVLKTTSNVKQHFLKVALHHSTTL